MPLKRLIQRNPVTPRNKSPDQTLARKGKLSTRSPDRVDARCPTLATRQGSKEYSKTQRLTQTSMSEPFPDQTPKGPGLETAGLRPGKKPSKIPTPGQHLGQNPKAARRKPIKGSSPHKNPIHNLKQQRRRPEPAPKLCSIDERLKPCAKALGRLPAYARRTGSNPRPRSGQPQRASSVQDRDPLWPKRARWWRRTGSNRRPEACKATALPTELRPLWPALPRAGRKHRAGPGVIWLGPMCILSAR